MDLLAHWGQPFSYGVDTNNISFKVRMEQRLRTDRLPLYVAVASLGPDLAGDLARQTSTHWGATSREYLCFAQSEYLLKHGESEHTGWVWMLKRSDTRIGGWVPLPYLQGVPNVLEYAAVQVDVQLTETEVEYDDAEDVRHLHAQTSKTENVAELPFPAADKPLILAEHVRTVCMSLAAFEGWVAGDPSVPCWHFDGSVCDRGGTYGFCLGGSVLSCIRACQYCWLLPWRRSIRARFLAGGGS